MPRPMRRWRVRWWSRCPPAVVHRAATAVCLLFGFDGPVAKAAPPPEGTPTEAPERAPARGWYREVELAAGSRFAQGGQLRELGRPGGPILDLGFRSFPRERHGFATDIVFDTFGGRRSGQVSPPAEPGERGKISGYGLLVGYVVRAPIGRRAMGAVSSSIGPYLFQVVEQPELGPRHSALVLPMRQRLTLGVELGAFPEGTSVALTSSLAVLVVPGGELGSLPLRGSSLGATVGIVMGRSVWLSGRP